MSYSNLVFSGGGVHGVAYVGALRQLEAMHIWPCLKNFAGSSVGSIFAAALACNASIDYLEQKLVNSNINDLFSISWFLPLDLYRLTSEYGICKGEELYEWLGQIFIDLTGDPDITFKYQWMLNNRALIITGTNLDRGITEYFSHSTTPDMPIRTAVRISAGYPFVYTAIFNDQQQVFVDGGLLDNYPIDSFDIANGDGTVTINPHTLGLRLTAPTKVSGGCKRIGKGNPREYIMSLINAMYNQAMRVHVDDADWARTIRINIGAVSSLEFDLTTEQKKDLVERGKLGVNKFFLTAQPPVSMTSSRMFYPSIVDFAPAASTLPSFAPALMQSMLLPNCNQTNCNLTNCNLTNYNPPNLMLAHQSADDCTQPANIPEYSPMLHEHNPPAESSAYNLIQ